jgi:phosphate transport system substrate-binding protein
MRRHIGSWATLRFGWLATPVLAQSLVAAPVPLTGSAPTIMKELAPLLLQSFDRNGSELAIVPPFGPPQGKLDPGLEAFLEGRRDFAFLTREIAEQDLATFKAHHAARAPLILPVAQGRWSRFGYADAVVIIVNRDNPLRSLSFEQIDAIFSSSHARGGAAVRHWADLSAELGDLGPKPVHLAGSDAWTTEESARALTIRRHVLSVGSHRGTWRRDVSAGPEADVVATVGNDPAAIGFTGMGHLTAAVRVVPIAPDDGDAILPTGETAKSGAYPLLRTVDLLFDPQRRSPVLCQFAFYLLSEKGQRAIRHQGDFAELPERARTQSRGRLRGERCPDDHRKTFRASPDGREGAGRHFLEGDGDP